MRFLLVLLISISVNASVVEVRAKLRPAGSFSATTKKVVGIVTRSGSKVTANEIKVDLNSLVTGISLRDRHMKEKLETDRFPEAVLTLGNGENGTGTAKLSLKGITKDISGKYEIDGNLLKADFNVKLSDYQITGVNYKVVAVKDEIEIHVEVPVVEK